MIDLQLFITHNTNLLPLPLLVPHIDKVQSRAYTRTLARTHTFLYLETFLPTTPPPPPPFPNTKTMIVKSFHDRVEGIYR